MFSHAFMLPDVPTPLCHGLQLGMIAEQIPIGPRGGYNTMGNTPPNEAPFTQSPSRVLSTRWALQRFAQPFW